jgi:hypothetical protein
MAGKKRRSYSRAKSARTAPDARLSARQRRNAIAGAKINSRGRKNVKKKLIGRPSEVAVVMHVSDDEIVAFLRTNPRESATIMTGPDRHDGRTGDGDPRSGDSDPIVVVV